MGQLSDRVKTALISMHERKLESEEHVAILRRNAQELLNIIGRDHHAVIEGFSDSRTAWKNVQASLIWFEHRDVGTLHPESETMVEAVEELLQAAAALVRWAQTDDVKECHELADAVEGAIEKLQALGVVPK